MGIRVLKQRTNLVAYGIYSFSSNAVLSGLCLVMQALHLTERMLQICLEKLISKLKVRNRIFLLIENMLSNH